MKAAYEKLTAKLPNESGQTMIIVILALGLFLLGAVGFGVDIANMWFHRQAAQTAADAACTAGAMDLLYNAEGEPAPATSSGSWAWIGQNSLDCSGHFATGSTMYAPCWYAAQNGYSGTGLVSGSASSDVVLNSPTSVSGASTCSSSSSSACLPSFISNPLLRVNVADRVRVFFVGMITGSKTMDVGAQAVCGVLEVQSPVPILVLNPTISGSLSGNGAITIDIYGGPQRSVQVNSSSTSAVSISGASGSINLSQGGPNETGSDMAVTGAESQVGIFNGGTTGVWISPDGPISDPFAMVCAPGQTTNCQTTMDSTSAPAAPTSPTYAKTGDGTTVVGPNDGCPSGVTCNHYQAGVYSNGIDVKNATAVFEPGLYYVTGGMTLDSNSQVCPGTGTGDGSGGTIFYFVDNSQPISVSANSGKSGIACSNSAKTQLTANDVKCTAASTLPGNLPGSTVLLDNILLAPCSGYYGDPLGTGDPTGEQRGILFFLNRSVSLSNKNQPQWGGGGAFTLGGSMYFHYCDSSTNLSGENCNFTSGFTDNLGLQGGSCSGTYILGDIVTDELSLGGNPCINMDLSTTASYYILKASLLQ